MYYVFTVSEYTQHDTYGLNDEQHSMAPIFIANGPSFKSSVRIDDIFSNIDLYHLFCRILGLEIVYPVDGIDRMDIWTKMLKHLDGTTDIDENCID